MIMHKRRLVGNILFNKAENVIRESARSIFPYKRYAHTCESGEKENVMMIYSTDGHRLGQFI
jgi:hypothetical protein